MTGDQYKGLAEHILERAEKAREDKLAEQDQSSPTDVASLEDTVAVGGAGGGGTGYADEYGDYHPGEETPVDTDTTQKKSLLGIMIERQAERQVSTDEVAQVVEEKGPSYREMLESEPNPQTGRDADRKSKHFSTLQDEVKEDYLSTMLSSIRTLQRNLLVDPLKKEEETDREQALREVAYRALVGELTRIEGSTELLRLIDDPDNPSRNSGVFKEIKVHNGSGFPIMTTYTHELRDLLGEAERRKRSSKRAPDFGAALEELVFELNTDGPGHIRAYDSLASQVREHLFLEQLQEVNLVTSSLIRGAHSDIRAKKLPGVGLVRDGNATHRFQLVFSGYNTSQAAFNSYVVFLERDVPKKGEPQHILLDGDAVKISEELAQLIDQSFGQDPYHMLRAIDSLEGVHPKHVSWGVLGPFYFEPLMDAMDDSKNVSDELIEVMHRHEGSGFLRYRRDHITSGGTDAVKKGRRKVLLEETVDAKFVRSDNYIVADSALRTPLAGLLRGEYMKIYENIDDPRGN